MATIVPNFSRILFDGLKKRKTDAVSSKSGDHELRQRILPTETPQKKQVQEDNVSDDETENKVSMFSSGTKILKVKDKLKKKKEIEEKKDYCADVRKLNRIYTWGDDIPPPFINFSELNLPDALSRNLSEFQINEPTPIQMQAIPLMLQKRDILASAPTGSGKTLAFLLPILKERAENHSQKLVALILEPTRVLARQVYVQLVKYCQNLDFKYAFYDEGEFPFEAQILVTTPTRLLEAAKKDEKVAGRLADLNWMVVDESDRLFNKEEGSSDLKQTLGQIFRFAESPHTRRAFFSATFSSDVELWCQEHLTNVAMLCIGEKNASNVLVTQELIFTGTDNGKMTALKDVLYKGFEPPAIIFVQDKDRAGQLFAELSRSFPKISCALISSEITDKQKDKILEQVRERTTFILICTELIGRGIDLPTVNLVINFDIPTSIVNYIHRVGRTGRGGRTGRAITYFTESDADLVGPIATVIHQAGFKVPPYTLGRLKENTKPAHRKAFTTRSRWEKVKKMKNLKKEIIPVDKLQSKKRKLIVDDDTGGDRIGSVSKKKYGHGKKNSLVKKFRKAKAAKKLGVNKTVFKKKETLNVVDKPVLKEKKTLNLGAEKPSLKRKALKKPKK